MISRLFNNIFVLGVASRYVLAMCLSVGTLAAMGTISPLYQYRPLLVAFIPAIIISALLGGIGPGLISTAVSCVGVTYFFFEPRGVLAVARLTDSVHLLFLVLSGLIVSCLGGLYRQSILNLIQKKIDLERSEDRYRSLTEASPAGVVLQNAEGVILEWNKKAEQLLGISREEVVGTDARSRKWLTCRVDNSEYPASEHPSMVTLKTGKSLKDQMMIVKSEDGGERWISINTEPIFGREGHDPQFVVVAFTDITEKILEERFVEEVDRIIRHDIKSPLLSIYSMVQLSKLDEYGDLSGYVPQIEHAVHTVLKLLDSAPKIRQIERGDFSFKMLPIDIVGLVRFAISSLLHVVTMKGVQVLILPFDEIQVRSCNVVGDQVLVEDMLLNLLKNAVEASPREGIVTVELGAKEGDVVVEIRNRGEVPPDIREKFFEKGASFGKMHGSGLGTYSAQLIAKAHGGQINLDTSTEGATLITVILPGGKECQSDLPKISEGPR